MVPSIALAAFISGCAGLGRGASPSVPGGSEALVPSGYGTLFQDQFTLALQQNGLLVKVTPLAESVILLAAPDTYTRLHRLAESNRGALEADAGTSGVSLFLVSFFSRQPNLTYQPEDLHIVNRGLRYRPVAVRAITPGWGEQRLGQEESQIAVYAFDGAIDLEIDLAADYQGRENAGWTTILSTLRAERARVRARARR
ncbi:MAG: hypothetical protein BMS9Abin29_0614 [Gemmatimonadota bacterium]|nr:MAG: hypothetical protein BMS9Abin29_0614 [Gemmatimonadota bacterium]